VYNKRVLFSIAESQQYKLKSVYLRGCKINFFKQLLNRYKFLCLLLSTVLLPLSYVQAAEPLGCIIEPERVAEVGSPVIGVVESIRVERGDLIKKGQVLATLRADVERASVDVATTRSQAEAEVRSAEATLKLARVTQKRQEDLVDKRFISQQALDKSIADTAISEQKLALTREQLRTWNSELSLARAQLGQRVIRSPIDGIIADRYIWPGERVEEKAMFRVAQISPLRVEMVISAAQYGTVSKGMKLNVVPQVPNAQVLEATVVLVDKLIDGASNTFRVRAEIPNKDSAVPSGLRCKVKLPDATQPIIRNDSGTAVTPNKTSTITVLPKNMKFATYKVENNPSTNIANSIETIQNGMQNDTQTTAQTFEAIPNKTQLSQPRITKSLVTNAQGAALQTFKIKPANKSTSNVSASNPIKMGNMKWETELTQIEVLKPLTKPTTHTLPR
jgi:RND family efflux transporter MFP subunit